MKFIQKLLFILTIFAITHIAGAAGIIQSGWTTTGDPAKAREALGITNNGTIIYTFETNFIAASTNFYINDTYVSNYFNTNLFQISAISNYFNTNQYFFTTNLTVTNTYITNFLDQSTTVVSNTTLQMISTNNYVSNYFQTNIFNSFSNFITTNLFFFITNITANYITNLDTFVTSNLFTTNLYTTNITAQTINNITNISEFLITSNIFTTNLYTTNITAQTINNITNISQFLITSNIFTTNLYTTNITAQTINNITNLSQFLITSNFYTTNLYTTNITAETINNITNISQYLITTNLSTFNTYTTNLTVNNLYVLSNAIGPWIENLSGTGTNTTLFTPTLITPIYIVSSNGPARLYFLDADNLTTLAGWDTNLGGFFGNGSGLTNISGPDVNIAGGANITLTTNGNQVVVAASGTLTSQYYASNAVSGGQFNTNTLAANNGANGWVLSQSNAVTVWTRNGGNLTNLPISSVLPNGTGALTNNGSGTIGYYNNYAPLDANNVFSASNTFSGLYVVNGQTNNNLTASTILQANANKSITSVANAAGALTNNGSGTVGYYNNYASLDANNVFSGSNTIAGLYVTQGLTNGALTASQFVTTDANKKLVSTLDGSTLTNLTYRYTTNANNTGSYTFGKEWTTNISGNITLGAFTLQDATMYESMVIWVTNTGASVFTVTLPGGVQSEGAGRPPVYYSTNGANQDLKILVEHQGAIRTNSTAQHYW